ncbi:hypothetical protein [Methylobacterium oryzisoli]|uniref:hypothetical protein n=1 Tax=Methylobacterium oryzisoli TaxID=3385502 RepID=UPI003892251B
MAGEARALRSRLGNPVTGEDFWPRPDLVDDLCTDLAEDRGSRRLFALRRIGKTSVLLELERQLSARHDLRVIRIDAQGISRFGDFLTKLFEPIPAEGPRSLFGRLADSRAVQAIAPLLAARLSGQPAPAELRFQNEFSHRAAWAGEIEAALKAAGPIVLILDELPFMLRNMLQGDYAARDAEQFLATLRSWRMNAGLRMLLSGSIGLAQIRRTHGVQVADHIGDVIPVHLPPLAPDEAADMVDALARGAGLRDWSRALSEAIVAASAETWPIFLQYGFAEIRKTRLRDPAAVRSAIEARVRPVLDETFYEQFSTRLSRYGEDQRAARAILKAVAASPEPVPFATADAALDALGALERRDDLFEALREDDFLLFDTEAQSLRPASRLVPVWVRARAWGR